MNMKKVVLAGVLLVASFCGSAIAGEGEKLLFGFEQEECEKAAATFRSKNAFRVLENGDFLLDPPQSCEYPFVISGIVPMLCVQAEASQGKYSLKVPGPGRSAGTNPSVSGRHFFYVNPRQGHLALALDPRVNLRLPELFNTQSWYKGVFPADWSGWDCLRVDVKVAHNRPVTILLEVEDELVEPPVSQTYAGVKPGEWVTLELDLRRAVEERKLNLAKMCNIFIRFDGRKDMPEMAGRNRPKDVLERLAAYMDNIRLCRKDAACKTPLLQGERSAYTKSLPRAYAAELVWGDPGTGEEPELGVAIAPDPVLKPAQPAAETEKIDLSPPAVIDILPLVQKGFSPRSGTKGASADDLHKRVELQTVTAADSKHMLVAFAMPTAAGSMKFDKPLAWKYSPMAAVVTADGGKTWGGFGGPGEVPSFLHKGRKVWEGTAFDAGADVMGLHDDGCLTFRTALEYYPGDRVFLWRTVFTGEGWKKSPLFFVSGDLRWCSHAAQNVLRLPSGRLWCMFSGRGRYGSAEVFAKYSDDEGFTWHSWRGDGFTAAVPQLPGELRAELFPYGEHVGMIAPRGKWVLFDGKAWTEMPASPVRTPVQVVACGKEVYAIDLGGRLAFYDGAEWKPLELPGREDYERFYLSRSQGPGAPEWRSQQSFVVCGDIVLFVEPDKSGKKILCWRKPSGAAWAGPQTLVSEETPIADLVAPRYGLASFAPVAYNCWSDDSRKADSAGHSGRYPVRELKPWIKVLKAPAR